MNKRIGSFTVLLLLTCFLGNAQNRYFGFGDSNENFGFQTVETLEDECYGIEQNQDSFSYRIISNILEQMGLNNLNFRLRECPKMKNALAQTFPGENGRHIAFITYGRDWLNELASDIKNWEAIGVLAHELGHIQYLHVISEKGSNPEIELQADDFMGTQLARMGATLEEAQSCLKGVKPIKGSRTHPARQLRLLTVANAWYKERDKSANQLTEDTRLRDVTPRLILDRYSKQLGGYGALNGIKSLDYKAAISQTNNFQNGKSKKVQYELQITINGKESFIVDEDQNEKYRLVYGDKMINDSVYYKRPISSNNWNIGAPQIGTGTLVKKENHHFIQEINPVLKVIFDHIALTNNPDITKFELRTIFNGQECFVLSLPQQIIRHEEKNKNWFRATINTKNYYGWQNGLMVGSKQDENIEYFSKKDKPLIKNNKTTVRTTVIERYDTISNLKLPSIFKITTQEMVESVLKSEGKVEQYCIVKELAINE